MVSKYCAWQTCLNTSHTRPDLKFFPFPKSDKYARAWAKACRSPELLNKTMDQLTRLFICAEHFEDKCFTDKEKTTLVSLKNVYSIPTKFQYSENSSANNGLHDTNPELKLLLKECSDNKPMKICRLCSCLKSTVSLVPIYGSYYHSLMIKLQPFGIFIKLDDGLPAHICRTCAAKLLLVVETLEQFHESEQKLKLSLLTDQYTIYDQAKIVDPIVTIDDSNESSQNQMSSSKSKISQQNRQKEPNNESLERVNILQVENIEVNEEIIENLVKMELMEEEKNMFEPNPIQINSPIVKEEVEIEDILLTNVENCKKTSCQQPVSIEFQDCESTSSEKEQISSALENDPLSNEFHKHSCKHCGRIFVSNVFLSRHIENEHETVELMAENMIKSRTNQYKCTICQGVLKSSLAYLSHLKMHTAGTSGLELSKLKTKAFPIAHKMNSSIPIKIEDQKNDQTDDQVEDQTKRPPRKIQKVNILKKSDRKFFKCDLCGLSFSKKNELLLHVQAHKPTVPKPNTYINKPFRLEIQNREKKEINTTEEENKSHPQSKIFFVNMPNKNDAEIPIIDLVEDSNSRDQIIQNPYEKEEQKGEENEEINYFVELSENLEDSEFNLKTAIEMGLADRENMFMCTQCSALFATRVGLTKHIQKKHGDNPKAINLNIYKCGICKISFGTRKTYETHLNTHMSTKLSSVNKVCDICGYDTKNENMFKFHMDSHMQNIYEKNKLKKLQVFGLNLKELKCSICEEQFNTTSMLVTHMSSVHLVPCKQSNEEFQTQEKLNIHTTEVPIDSNYVCNICGHYFTNQESTYKHMVTHEMIKTYSVHSKLYTPLKCKICKTSLETKYMMYCHMEKHKGVLNAFACDRCDMKFDTDSKLKDHFLKHKPSTGFDGLHGCSICGKFILKESLKKHCLAVHCTAITNRKRKFDCDE